MTSLVLHTSLYEVLVVLCMSEEGRGSHEGEEEEGEGVENTLRPGVGQKVEVKNDGTHEIGEEGEDEEVANETLLVLSTLLLLLRESLQLLSNVM